MAARYDFRKVPSKKGNGEEPKLYPHIVSGGTIRTRTILEEISEASTFTVGDLEGVLCALTEKISKYLVDGYHVEFIIRKTKKPFWKNENGKSGREEGKTKTESSSTRTQKKDSV